MSNTITEQQILTLLRALPPNQREIIALLCARVGQPRTHAPTTRGKADEGPCGSPVWTRSPGAF